MPALVTTPVDAPIDGGYVPTKYIIATATTRTPVPPFVPPATATILRVVTGLPIRRWNGSAWITVYRPRF